MPEIININSKKDIREYPIYKSWYSFFNANVLDFIGILLLKLKPLGLNISTKN